jgi:hypothetical protein
VKGDFSGLTYRGDDGKEISSGNGTLDLWLENISVKTGDSLDWSATLKDAQIRNFSMDSIGKYKTNLVIATANAGNIILKPEWFKDLRMLIRKNPSLTISNATGDLSTDKNRFNWHGFTFNHATHSLSLDSFTYTPIADRDAFIKASPWQTDYMTLRTGKISVSKIDLDKYLTDSSVRVGILKIDQPYFTSYRDKHPPFKAGVIKSLPTHLVKKIPFPVSIDTVKISNGTIVYTELSHKTHEEGVIPVTRVNGEVYPIRNYNVAPNDSLHIQLSGYILDSAWVRLRVRESYTDSLAGFILTVQMRPRSLLYLNPVLTPLASIRLHSGYLDTLSMRVVGREHLSLGEIKMFYRDIKVQFLRNGDETKKGMLAGLKTFIANSFIIKRHNKNRVETVYFPRLRDRSFINYYIKMTMSGVATSVGAKKSRKMIKKYERELHRKHLPPIDF